MKKLIAMAVLSCASFASAQNNMIPPTLNSIAIPEDSEQRAAFTAELLSLPAETQTSDSVEKLGRIASHYGENINNITTVLLQTLASGKTTTTRQYSASNLGKIAKQNNSRAEEILSALKSGAEDDKQKDVRFVCVKNIHIIGYNYLSANIELSKKAAEYLRELAENTTEPDRIRIEASSSLLDLLKKSPVIAQSFAGEYAY